MFGRNAVISRSDSVKTQVVGGFPPKKAKNMATILKYKIKVLGFIHTTFIYLFGQFGGFEGWCVPKTPPKTTTT